MLGYKPHFVPQDNFLFQPEHTAPLQQDGVDCAYAPYDTDFEDYMRRYGCAVRRGARVPRARSGTGHRRAAAHAPQAPVLFNNMDLHYLRMQRAAEMAGDAAALARPRR